MGHLIFLLVSCALLIGFFVVTQYEKNHSRRFFAERRAKFDGHIERIIFIMEHVDLPAFVRDEIRHLANRLGHFAVHISLQAVRAVERVLTRLVRLLRARYADTVIPRENAREFVKTLSEFKDTLKRTPPDISDIQ